MAAPNYCGGKAMVMALFCSILEQLICRNESLIDIQLNSCT